MDNFILNKSIETIIKRSSIIFIKVRHRANTFITFLSLIIKIKN